MAVDTISLPAVPSASTAGTAHGVSKHSAEHKSAFSSLVGDDDRQPATVRSEDATDEEGPDHAPRWGKGHGWGALGGFRFDRLNGKDEASVTRLEEDDRPVKRRPAGDAMHGFADAEARPGLADSVREVAAQEKASATIESVADTDGMAAPSESGPVENSRGRIETGGRKLRDAGQHQLGRQEGVSAHEPFAPAAERESRGGDVEATSSRAGLIGERDPEATDPRPSRTEAVGSRIAVLSAQSVPAPTLSAGSVISSTGAAFVESVAAPDGLPRHESGQIVDQQHAPRSVTTLKIQLQPADLGTVTVTLSGKGDDLSIEVQVHNHEARHRLQTDSDSIVKALRGLGYDIDRITVQQVPQSSAAPGGTANRENGFAAPDERSGGRQEQSRQQNSGQRYEDRHDQRQSGGERRNSVMGGVVI